MTDSMKNITESLTSQEKTQSGLGSTNTQSLQEEINTATQIFVDATDYLKLMSKNSSNSTGLFASQGADSDTTAAINELDEIIEDGYRLVEELDKKQTPDNTDSTNNASHS